MQRRLWIVLVCLLVGAMFTGSAFAQDDDVDIDDLLVAATTAYGDGDYETAVDIATTIIEADPQNLAGYIIRADSYRQLDENELAAADYGMAIEFAPDDSEAWFYRGLTSYRAGGDDVNYERIISDMDRALELGFFDEAWAYNIRGLSNNRLGNYEEAIADMTMAIENAPSYRIAYSNRAFIYGNMDDWFGSMPDRKYVLLELAPNSAVSYNNLAWGYVQLEQYQEALGFVQLSLDLDPTDSNAIDTRGWAYWGLGEYDLAIEDFEAAIDAGNTYAFYGLGAVYNSLGDTELAIENLRIYIEEEGEFAEDEAIELLESLESGE